MTASNRSTFPVHEFTSAEYTAAADTNLAEKSLSFARLPCGQVYGPNPLWFMTGSQISGYNGVVKAAFPADRLVDDCIRETLQPFQARGLPLTWWTGPSTQPGNLGARLQAHGFVHNRDMIGMAADIERLSAPHSDQPALNEDLPSLEIEPVKDAETLAEWLPIYSQGFGTPPAIAKESLAVLARLAFEFDSGWKHFLVRREGRISAISSLFISGEVAGLYNLVTLKEERGQGIGAAMTLGTFAIGKTLGCRIATLQTTYPNALRLYHRLGFEVYCKFGIYQKVSGK